MTDSEPPALGGAPLDCSCPSARCEEGAILLGIVGADGVLGYVAPRMEIDADFCHEARKAGRPETRFRFSQPCVEHECAQWTGSRCGLIHQVLESAQAARLAENAPTSLPQCVIRPTCRWFAQAAERACAICPWIVHSPEDSPAAGNGV